PGLLLQDLPPSRPADGAPAPSLRDYVVVGDQEHSPLLDRRRRLLRDRLHAVPAVDRTLTGSVGPPLSTGRTRVDRGCSAGGSGDCGDVQEASRRAPVIRVAFG